MLHAASLLLVLGLTSPASPGGALSVRAESRVVAAVQRVSPLVAVPGARTPASAAAGDLAEAARSAPDAWARTVAARLGVADHAVTRAAIFVLAVPVQLDVGPNRVRVTLRVPLP
jgi:hypothetical protein